MTSYQEKVDNFEIAEKVKQDDLCCFYKQLIETIDHFFECDVIGRSWFKVLKARDI